MVETSLDERFEFLFARVEREEEWLISFGGDFFLPRESPAGTWSNAEFMERGL